MKIVNASQMQRIEEMSESAGISKRLLLMNAGLGIAKTLGRYFSPILGRPVVILAGPGNNGNDGLIAASYLQQWGANVLVYLCGERLENDPYVEIVRQSKVKLVLSDEDKLCEKLRLHLSLSHVVVDAILGIGNNRPIDGSFKQMLEVVGEIRNSHEDISIVSIDVPSGMDASTGEVDPSALIADITIAMGYAKFGHVTYPGVDFVGQLVVIDIGIPEGLDEDIKVSLFDPGQILNGLPERPSHAHKGTFGKTMIFAGSSQYLGAPELAAIAALRIGAGLVTIALPEGLVPIIAAKTTETTFLPLPETSLGEFSSSAVERVRLGLVDYDALLLGCGIGLSSSAKRLIERLLLLDELEIPIVVDADALNILSWDDEWWKKFTKEAILTPHAGEMSRLTGYTVDYVQKNRLSVTLESAKKWNKVIVLKGAFTVIACPNGFATISPFANAGLATAGTGDVLAGVIVGLLSQGVTLRDAAVIGVNIHALTGERIRKRIGQAGLLAGDLLHEIPYVIAQKDSHVD